MHYYTTYYYVLYGLFEQDEPSKLDGKVDESITQTTAYKTILEKKLASCPEENETPQHMMNEVRDH
jgi:hypothetical protein